jgi:uncharacterized protein YutE (UPF0331/DUF86 family)
VDQVILAQKLESLRRCVKRIEDKAPPDLEQLIQDPDLQDILVLNLTRAIQLRNVAVHNYDVIKWEIVFAISRKFLVDFRRFAKEITEYGMD